MVTVDRRLLLDGIEGVLPPEMTRIEAAHCQVLDLFHHQGYEFVVTPHIEYLESLLTGTGQDLDLHTFKVTDPASDQFVGFRADIMPQMARMGAHSLRREGPSRLCYVGGMLHTQPHTLSTSRSLIRLGAGLYGGPSPTSDVEMVSLMLGMLEMAEVPDVHMDLDYVGTYCGLACVTGLSGEVERQLFDALQRKAVDETEALTVDLSAEPCGVLRALAELCSNRDTLEQGRARLAATLADIQMALNELIEIADSLAGRFPGLPLCFDLGELRGYYYHTDAVFAAFVPDVGQSTAQGGRYDDIGADFGCTRPATGFSTDLKSPATLGQARLDQTISGIWTSVEGAELWQAVQQLRRDGQRVVQALPGQDAASACETGCDQQLVLRGGNWQVAPLAS